MGRRLMDVRDVFGYLGKLRREEQTFDADADADRPCGDYFSGLARAVATRGLTFTSETPAFMTLRCTFFHLLVQ